MGYAQRASDWKKRQPWQGLAHPHTGKYGLLGVLVDGVPEGVECTILLGVGPEKVQQIAATLIVTGSGEARFEQPVNMRDGIALWYKSSLPGVNVASRTADILKTPAERRVEHVINTMGQRARFGVLGRVPQALNKARLAVVDPTRPRAAIDDSEAI